MRRTSHKYIILPERELFRLPSLGSNTRILSPTAANNCEPSGVKQSELTLKFKIGHILDVQKNNFTVDLRSHRPVFSQAIDEPTSLMIIFIVERYRFATE